MGDGDAFGFACGAGGVDHVGQVVRRDAGDRGAGRVVGDLQIVHEQHLGVGGHGQCRRNRWLRQQHQGAAVFEHVGDAFGRVIRVQRHIGATALEYGEQRDQQVLGTLHGYADTHFRANAQCDQPVSQAIGLGIELGVGQLPGGEGHCQCAGVCRDLPANQFVNAQLLRERFVSAIPVMHDALVFSGFQHWQFTDALPAIADHALQQTRPVLRHARDGRGVEQVVGVGQRSMQPAAFFIGVEGQVELGGAPFPLDHPQSQAGRSADGGDVRDLRLVVVHHLEQRCVTKAALELERFDQALERQVLVGLGAEGGFLDGAQQVVDPGLTVQLGAQYLSIDEEADQAFDLGAIAVGNRHADADVGLPGVAMQQRVKGAQQKHEQGDVVLLGRGSQLLGQLRVDGELVTGAAMAGQRRARVVGGQLQHRVFIAQLRLPVVELPRLLARFQPAPLPQGVVAVLDRQWRQLRLYAGFKSVVAANEFVDQHVHRPAVGHDVVQGQQQDVFLCCELEQGDSQQWAGG